jgi:hypothetical protein
LLKVYMLTKVTFLESMLPKSTKMHQTAYKLKKNSGGDNPDPFRLGFRPQTPGEGVGGVGRVGEEAKGKC